MIDHEWVPAFWGDSYQTYRCTKCSSVKRVQEDEVTYCEGRPTLLTEYLPQEPPCQVSSNNMTDKLRDKQQIALVTYPDGTIIAVQNPEEARIVCQVQGVDPNECIRIIDFFPAQMSGLAKFKIGQAYVTAAEDLRTNQRVASDNDGHACLPTPERRAVGTTLGFAMKGEAVLVQFDVAAWNTPLIVVDEEVWDDDLP